jgi:WD40 repeat protein
VFVAAVCPLSASAGVAEAAQPAFVGVLGSPFLTSPADTSTAPSSVAFSPASGLLAAGTGGGVLMFRVAADGTLTRVPGSPFHLTEPDGFPVGTNSVAFSPGGGLVATVNTDETVSAWRVAANGILMPVSTISPSGPAGAAYFTLSLAFSPDGELLATANANLNFPLGSAPRYNVSVFKVKPDGTLEHVPVTR